MPIFVSGTKRSGTSMWMQILAAAGMPVLGQAFPRNWERSSLKEANRDGFYESQLRHEVYFRTNPHPVRAPAFAARVGDMIATVRVHISLLLCACVAACGDDDGSGDSMGESGGTTAGGTTSSTGSDATSEAPTSDPIPGTSTGSDTGTETGTDTSTGADGSTGGMDYGEYEACASYGATLAECFHEGDPAEAAVAEGVCNDYIGYHFMSPDGAPACAAAFEALAACIGGSSCKELVGRRACPTETEVAEEACPNLPNP